MAFGPNNQYLFTAGGGNENQSLGTVTRWQLSNYQSVQLARFQGVAYSISTAIQDARRDVLVAFGGVRRQGDRNVGFVTMIRPDDTKTEAQDAPVYAVALCRDGTQLAAGSGKFTLLWTGTNDAAIRLPTSGVVRSVVFSPDGSKLAAGGLDGIITVWNTRRPASAPSVVPVHRVQIKVIDGRTKQPIGDARITPQGGAGSCNLLAWYRPSAIHRFEATKPGRYTFVVRHKDYPAQTVQYQVGAKEFIQTVSLNRVVAPPTPPPTPKLVSLLLKVQHADGSLVADPSIQFTAGPGRETYEGEGAGGTLRYDVTKAGDYRVRVSKKGYTPQTVAVRAEVGGKPRTVVLHRIFKLLLTVLDTDKQPIAGPAIEIEPKERSELLSETRGTHVFSLTTAGTYKVTVSKKVFKGQTTTLSVRNRETRHTIEMGWGFELLLTVVDTDRNPIDGPTIGISGPGKHRKMGAKDGVHTYSLTSNGRYEITVSKPGYESKTKSLDVELGTRDDTFELKAIEYDLVVRVPGAGDLEVMAPAGRKATRTEEGVYTLRLRPGMYEVELKAGAVERQRVTIHNKDLELDFEPPVEDAVRELHKLLDTNADLRVDKKDYPTGWEQVKKFDTNGNGQFDLDELAAWLKQFDAEWDKAQKGATKTDVARKADPESDLDEIVRRLDTDQNGKVEKKDCSDLCWEQLRPLDADGNEIVSRDELRKRPTAPPPAKREAPEAVAGTLTIRRVGG
jgi:WD40 repeat protein